MTINIRIRGIVVALFACISCCIFATAKEGVAVFLAPTQELTFEGDTISAHADKVASGSNGQDLTAGPVSLHTSVSVGNYFALSNSKVSTASENTSIKKIFFVASVLAKVTDYSSITEGVKFSFSKYDVTITPTIDNPEIQFKYTGNSINRIYAIYVTYETEESEVTKGTWSCPLADKNVEATMGEDLNLNYFLNEYLSGEYAENPPTVIYTITNPDETQYELVGSEDSPDYKCIFRVLEASDSPRYVNIRCSWDENDYWNANTDGGSFTINVRPTEVNRLKINFDEQSGNSALEASGTDTTIGRTGYNLSVNEQADTDYYFYLNDDSENTCELADTMLIRPGQYGNVSVLPGEVYTITVVANNGGEISTATTDKFLTQPNIEIEDAPIAEAAVTQADETPTDKIISLKVAGADTKIYYSIGDSTKEAAEQEYSAPVRVNVGEHITYYASAEGLTSPKVVYAPQDITVSTAMIIDSNGAAEYFDMQGRRVETATPAPGFYICKTSNGTNKIIIR